MISSGMPVTYIHNVIGDAARSFEQRCRSEKNPDKIVLTIPAIKTDDEIKDLAQTLSRMSATVKKC